MSAIREILKEQRLKINKIGADKRKNELVSLDFSIISNNCFAGIVYQHYNLEYNTPTVGLYFFPKDFIKFCQNFSYYMDKKIKFIDSKASKYYKELREKGHENNIIGCLDDVEIVFLHYKTQDEVLNKWERRKQRLSKNIIFKFNDQNGCKEEDIKAFDELDVENKICFTSKNYNKYKSCIWLKKYKDNEFVKEDYYSCYKYIDITKYINSTINPNLKRILLCCNTLEKGGAERVICNLANYLSNKYEIEIATIWPSKPAYELNNKIKLHHLSDKNLRFGLSENNYNIFKIYSNLKKCTIKENDIIEKFRPQVILSFLPTMSFITMMSNKKCAKTIIGVRNDPKHEYGSGINYYLMKKLYSKTDAFVFQTKEQKEYFDLIMKKDSEIIQNPINPDFMVKQPFALERKKEIVSVGRLNKQKNYPMLIKAFNKFYKNNNDYSLVIYGEGPERENLTNLISELNMQNHIKLPGLVDNVKDNIYDANMFVLSSIFEGMPNSLLEAMSLGLPVIATDCPCGGPKAIIKNNENGILIPNNDELALIDAMNKIASDNKFSNKLSLNAINIQKEYSVDKVNEKWDNFINKIYKG